MYAAMFYIKPYPLRVVWLCILVFKLNIKEKKCVAQVTCGNTRLDLSVCLQLIEQVDDTYPL